MILSKYAYTKISPSNFKYWKERGYCVGQTGGRCGINTKNNKLRVKITDLADGSNINVSCRCDLCSQKYIQRFCRNTGVCYDCRKSQSMQGNVYGAKNKGRPNPNQRGDKHPRWNPNKPEFISYGNRVRWISEKNYRANKQILNPHDHPRGRMGVPGAYQLDHVKSVKDCFLEGLTIEEAGSLENLQMLSWEANRRKW